MDKIKLKPCPFCGKKDAIVKQTCLENSFTSYVIFHSEFDCSIKISSKTVYDTPEDAAAAWNKRVPGKEDKS